MLNYFFIGMVAAGVAWNLFLALVPVIVARYASIGICRDLSNHGRVRWALWGPVLLVWLVFLPNTAYLLADWRHYAEELVTYRKFLVRTSDPTSLLALLCTTLYYAAFTGCGPLTFSLSIWPLDRALRERIGRWRIVILAGVCVLSSFGVYLGLIDRLNSWDLVHPQALAHVGRKVVDAFHHPLLLGVTVGFGLALWVIYAVFDLMMDGLEWRRKRSESV